MTDTTFTEPTESDLLDAAALEADALAEDVDWEALLPAPITAAESDEFWTDEAPEDDRWGTTGMPVWSVWA